MKLRELKARLQSKLKNDRLLLWLGSLFSFGLGLFVLFLTFWFTYGLLWFVTGWMANLSHETMSIGSGVFLVLLFIGNATTDREYLDHIELNIGPHRDLEVAIARVSGYGWMLAFSDPQTARSTLKMVTTLLFTGPRAVVQAWQLIRRAMRVAKIDLDLCTTAIGKAYRAEARVPFEKLLEDVPEAFQQKCVEDLSYIQGVVLLTSEPAGITLAPELVRELSAE